MKMLEEGYSTNYIHQKFGIDHIIIYHKFCLTLIVVTSKGYSVDIYISRDVFYIKDNTIACVAAWINFYLTLSPIRSYIIYSVCI